MGLFKKKKKHNITVEHHNLDWDKKFHQDRVFVNPYKEKVKKGPVWSRSFHFPLYFGWEIVFTLQKIADKTKQIVGPFKTYKAYMTAVVLLIFVFSSAFFISNRSATDAATFFWQQTDWSGDDSANNANHTSNQTGWDEYSAKDTNIAATTEVVLTESSSSITETDDTDFGAGTTSNTGVLGSGDSANIVLNYGETTLQHLPDTTNYDLVYDSFTDSIWVSHKGTDTVSKLSATTHSLIGTYDAGNGPEDMIFETSTNSIWTINTSSSGHSVTKISAADGSLTGTYTGITSPAGLIYDPSTESIWVISNGLDSVVKLSAETGSVIGTYDVGTTPYSITYASSDDSIWVGDRNLFFTKLSAADGSLIGTYNTLVDRPEYMTYDSITNSIWVASEGGDNLTKFSAADGSLINDYNTGNYPRDLIFDSSTNSIWTITLENNYTNIRKFSIFDGSVTDERDIGYYPTKMAIDPSTNSIWTVSSSEPYLTKLSTTNASQITAGADSDYNVGDNPQEIAFDSSTNSIWVANDDSNNVTKLSAADGSLLGTYSVGGSPMDVTFDSSTNSIWVANAGSNNVTKLLALDGSVTGTYNVGTQPYAITFDSSTNSIWIANAGSNNVTKLLALDGSVTGTYNVGTDPRGITFESLTDSIWVTNYDTGNVTKLLALDGSLINTYAVGAQPDNITFDSSTNSIWVAIRSSVDLVKLSALNGSVTASYSNIAYGLKDLTFDSVTNSIWATNWEMDDIYRISPVDGSVIAKHSVGNKPIGIIFDSATNSIWVTNSDDDNITKIPLYSYSSSGTFTSQILDTTVNSSFGNTSWSSIVPPDTTLSIRARTSDDAGMSGAGSWATCDTLTSGNDISTNNCVADKERYIQYYASLTSSDVAATSALEDITLAYNTFPTSQTLTSSAFDSSAAENVLSSLTWTEDIPTNTEVKYQLRTAPDSTGSPGAWSSWLGPTGVGDYYSNPAGETINSTHTDITNDQWMQYKVWLTSSDQMNTPTLSDVALTYVVNAPPEFEANPTVSQNSDGTVTISYSIRDIDTDDGSSTPGFVTPSFEYSINGGNDWDDIATGLPASATTQKAVDQVDYTDYQVIWTAKDQTDGTYTTEAQIRITITDSELANSSAVATSSDYAMDVKDPALGTYPIVVDALNSPSGLTLDASDDNSLQMKISLNSDLSGASWESYNSSSTIALATDPDTVYTQFIDAFSNITTVQSVVSPETPDNIIIRDLSNPNTDDWQFFISWGSVAIPVDEFTSYRVWHSTDGVNYTLQTSIADRSINYYLHIGLVQDSDHYYKISTERDDGSKSYYSTVVTDVVDGQGGTDSTSPDLSNVSISSINTQSALVTWDTGELSDSTVGYSTSAGVFTTEVGSPEMVDSNGNYGPHEIILTGLTPGTKYYVQVTSEDPSGNTTSDSDGGDGFTFTTLSGPAISNVTTTSISNTKSVITWITDINANSIIYYSTNSDLSDAQAVTDETSTKIHELSVTSLTPGTKYYYYVQSGVAIDNNSNNYYLLNTTLDNANPIISSVIASPVTDTQAVIQWLTNEMSTSQISYGLTSSDYSETTTLDESMNITHSITLNNLTASTTYYYQVTSLDASENSSSSIEKSFTTLETLSEESTVEGREDLAREEGRTQAVDEVPPTISDVVISDITSNSTKISWATNENTNSFIQFGLTNEYEKIYGNWAYQTTHEIILRGLLPQSEYHYRVISVDKGENMITTEDDIFTTILVSGDEEENEATLDDLLDINSDLLAQLAPQVSIDLLEASLTEQNYIIKQLSALIPTPLIGGVPLVTTTSSSASITWTTDKDANSLVAYSPESVYTINNESEKYSQVVGNSESFQKTHTVTISNLTPETSYHYQLRSKTEISDTTTSADYTFTTEKKSFGIENYSVEKLTNEKAIFSWVTTEKANSVLTYTPYRDNVLAVDEKSVITDDNLNLIHQVDIDTFESGVVYSIELTSTDENDNISVVNIESFTTNEENAAPLITQIQTDSALSPGGQAKVQTIVSWRTNEPATSQIYFQQGVGEIDTETAESTQLDTNYTKDHVVIITTFESGSVYQFQVESTDSSGLVSLSSPITILTPQEEQTVFEVIFGAMEDAFGWLRVFNQ